MALKNRERIDALLTQANTLSKDIHEQRIQEMANVNAGGGGSGLQITTTTTTVSNYYGFIRAIIDITNGVDDNVILCSLHGDNAKTVTDSGEVNLVIPGVWCRPVSARDIAFPIGIMANGRYNAGILMVDGSDVYLSYGGSVTEEVTDITGTVQIDTITIKRSSLNP